MADIPSNKATLLNEELANFATKRTILGLRYDASLSREVLAILNDLEVDLIAQIQRQNFDGRATTYNKQKRLEIMLKETRKMMSDTYSNIDNLSADELSKLANLEANATVKGVTSLASNISINLGVSLPAETTMVALTDRLMVMGQPLTEYWSRQEARFFDEFSRSMRIGISAGESVPDLAKRVAGDKWGDLRTAKTDETRGAIQKARRDAKALVRTSVASVQGESRQAVFEGNLDVIKQFVQLSRLDSRTSDICIARAGKAWDAKTKQPVDGNSFPYQLPPLHANCRSVMIPRIIGGGLPIDKSADEWLGSLSVTEQEDLLGKGKSQLYRDGKIKASDLIDQTNRPLTLKELESLS